ncbi:MAG: rhomboid family intramembrane serine protease [Siculibacillus sp.]
MTTTSFGRRGVATRIDTTLHKAGFTEPQEPARIRRDQPTSLDDISEGHDFEAVLALLPVITAATIVLLMVVFLIQKRFAYDVGAHGAMSHESLLALGAASRDLVIRGGQLWRVFTAPLMHLDSSHLFGNLFALFWIGMRLEPIIGRGWFSTIFLVSALTGVIGSLAGNPAHIVTVGASGAITGVIGAALVMSFHRSADEDHRRKMRKSALWFGVPALLPLVFGGLGNTDYNAHLGGALGGAAVGLVLITVWNGYTRRPPHARMLGLIATFSLFLPLGATVFAAAQYGDHGERASRMIPQKMLPTNMRDGAAQSLELIRKYPDDPRGHLFRALALQSEKKTSEAEREFRAVLAMVPENSTDVFRPTRDIAIALLATSMASQGRRDEALRMAAPICNGAFRLVLTQAKLCS